MLKRLLVAALITGFSGLCQEAWSDDHIHCLLRSRKSPNLVASEMSVYLKLQPLTLFERKFAGQSTTLGKAISGYDAYSFGLSHLQLRSNGVIESAESDGAFVSNTLDPLLINERTPSCVILVRGAEGYVFPTAFLSSPAVQLTKIQDEDIIATIFMPPTLVSSSDNDSLRELALSRVEEVSDGAAGVGGEASNRSGQELRYITSGLLFKTEFQTAKAQVPINGIVNINPNFTDSEWSKRAFETISAANLGPLSGRSVVWVLHRNKPFRGVRIHYIIPAKGIGSWGVEGAAFKSLLSSRKGESDQWDKWRSRIVPNNLLVQDGDHLELTDLDLVGPFCQISVR